MMEKMVKRKKDVKYIERRPRVSENDDHQSGKMAMLNMYNATERFAILGWVFKSIATCGSDAVTLSVYVPICLLCTYA